MAVLILIPAYNEAARIVTVIENIRRVAPEYDIVVINDGSGDDTAPLAATAGATVVSHPFNLGYGVAIQTGYKYAFANGYDYLVQIDGDGQHDPSYIPLLLAPVMSGKADFILGSRFLEVAGYEPSLARKIGMAFFRQVVSWIANTRITDSTSGYQAFNRDVIRFFSGEVFPCDYPDADMLITLHLADFRISELPVRMYANTAGKSMHSGLKPAYYIFKMLLSILVTLLRSRKFYRRY
jgi:glycosyltransferase involved in cell wall biosynthesis